MYVCTIIYNFFLFQCPQTAVYIPNFISSEEEQLILSYVEKTPKPKWTQLLNRRLINYGGIPHSNGMVAEVIPGWLQTYVNKINSLGIFETQKANHVLVNEYKPGQGIMPHADGPLFYPTISTISCGSHTVLELRKKEIFSEYLNEIVAIKSCSTSQDIVFKLIMEPRSLLILKDDLYENYLHSISELSEDILCDRIYNYENCGHQYKIGDCLKRGTRISLTIRHVPKTTKTAFKFINK